MIAFVSQRDGNQEIYTMSPDGTGVANLTANGAADLTPTPGDGKLAFRSNRADSNYDIYSIASDGSNLIALAANPSIRDVAPTWSPDSEHLASVTQVGINTSDDDAIVIVDADGTNSRELIAGPVSSPRWSPTDDRIVYELGTLDPDLWVVAASGGESQKLTDSSGSNRDAVWSPDGEKIAFTSTRDGNVEIYVVNADGTNTTRITRHEGLDYSPDWSPDGRRLVFFREHNDLRDIYVIDADGNNEQRVAFTSDLAGPKWRPCYPSES